MTRRRRLLVFGLLAGLLALGIGAWLLSPRTTVITRENAANLRAGMSLAEVEEILGPERDDSTGPTEGEWLAPEAWMLVGGHTSEIGVVWHSWSSDSVLVLVELDAEGRVARIDILPFRRAQESPLAMLRHWLRL
jgi:hypothetical protein